METHLRQNIYCLLSFIQSKSKFSYHEYLYYIESLLEILYEKPIATKSVMTPAKMVTIKFVLITQWNKTVLTIAGNAIIRARNVPFMKIFDVEILLLSLPEFESNFNNSIFISYKILHDILQNKDEIWIFSVGI